MHRGCTARQGTGRLVALGAASLLLAACASSAARPVAPSKAVGTKLDAAVPTAVASLPFTDSSGRTRHLSDYAGKVLVISDSMTLCQETCPIDTSTLVETARDVAKAGAAKDVQFLTITVDPRRDTPHRLGVYQSLFHPAPANWTTLTGTPRHVAALWRYFGVFTKRVASEQPAPRDWLTGKPLTYDIQHSDEVFFLDARTHERFVLDGTPYVPGRSAIPAKLYRFMSAQGHHNVAHPSGSAWTPRQALQVISWLDQRQVGQS